MNSATASRCGALALALMVSVLGPRQAWGCLVTADCPGGQFCAEGICATATPTIFITRTPTLTATQSATRTITPTPTASATWTFTATAVQTPSPTRTPTALGPAIAIDDVVAGERTSPFVTFFDFTVTLSQRRPETVTVSFATADGTATAGSDYVARSGTLTFSPGVTVLPVRISVSADAFFEPNETFFVNLSGASIGVRIADAQGEGVIQNDDAGRVGLAALTPPESVTRAGEPLPVTLSWTDPVRWRDLDTVDLRLRGAHGITIWLRFDEAANTFALVDPTDATPGAGFPPGQPGELAAGPVTVLLDASSVRADGPDAPRVDLTFTFSFAPEALGETYTVEAAATDDSGDAQDFEDVGTITIAAALPCPGDCDGDGAVRVNELLTGVNIALDAAAFGLCPSFDANGDVSVEVGELVAAVNEALTGCP